MLIYIPTYKRVGRLTTLQFLSDEWQRKTYLVIRPEELGFHEWPASRTITCATPGVPAARQAAVCHARAMGKNCFMFDDDLRFAIRPPGWKFPKNTKLRKATIADVSRGLDHVHRMLMVGPSRWTVQDGQPIHMLGFDARGGNNQRECDDVQFNCRVMRAFGVNTKTLEKHNIRFDTFPFWEDFHVALSLIAHGYRIGNLMNYTNDAGTNTAGGCSTYRNYEALARCQTLFALEHKHAKPVLKRPKSWGGALGADAKGIPDFVIYWKKAVQDATDRLAARRR